MKPSQVAEQERWGLPRYEDYDAFQREDDQLRIVVRGWQWVEGSLALAIADRLPAGADFVELDRMTTRTRIDLCAGMGVFPSDTHGSFVRMNTVRNQFVHKQKTRFAGKDRLDLFNTWSATMKKAGGALKVNGRSSATEILRATVILQLLLVRVGIEEYRDEGIRRGLFYERLFGLADQIRMNRPISELPPHDHEAEFAQRKLARQTEGQL